MATSTFRLIAHGPAPLTPIADVRLTAAEEEARFIGRTLKQAGYEVRLLTWNSRAEEFDELML